MSPRKMPTKTELLRLQKLYRTDSKISEVLGVSEHLVAYWRRKKGISKYSFPKFSEKDVQEVWDRFGDDFHAGMELGISKAAFYNWRRRYKITRKPAALKLEQLSLELFSEDKSRKKRIGTGRQTVVQKIMGRAAGEKSLGAGEQYIIEADTILAVRTLFDLIEAFSATGTVYVKHPNRMIVALDCMTPSPEGINGDSHHTIRDFVRLQKVAHFFEFGGGCPCQTALERGLILPGKLVVSGDGPAMALGAVGALVLAIEKDKMVSLWSDGKTAMTVPETLRVNITGRPPRGTFARDIAHYMVSQLRRTDVAGKMLELYGTGIDQMSVAERITICTLITTLKPAGVICPFDATTRRYISPRARTSYTPILADRNAVYAAEYTFEINTVKSLAAASGQNDKIIEVEQLDSVPVHQVYLGGITNGRFSDLKIAADILKGKTVAENLRLFVQPVTRSVYLEALKKGLIRVFIEAGAVVLNPGCPGNGTVMPSIAGDETCLSTHFDYDAIKGAGKTYQTSPATAAASAVTGFITEASRFIRM